MPAKKPCCTLRKLETSEAENGRTGRHVLGQEPDQQWGAAPQNGSDMRGWCLDGGLHYAPLSSAPTHVPVPRSLNCRTASPAVQCALRLHSQLHSVHPAQRHAVGLASKQALGWLGFKRHFLADTVCCVCFLSAQNFSLHILDLCDRALKRGRRLQFVQIYYRLASTMLRRTNVHKSR